MLKIIQKILAFLAKRVVNQYKPEIIGITGSVGKTSTKEAIAGLLSANFRVRETYKNYNNEIGLPLSVLGLSSPGRSMIGWLKTFIRAWRMKSAKIDYPEILVLEMGIDRPGDMDYLTSIIKPTRAVITKLGQAHLEFFNSLDHLHNEKMKLAEAVSEDGWVIYNYDDERLRELAEKSTRRTISFGLSSEADISAEELSIVTGKSNEIGTAFKLKLEGSFIPVFLPGAIGRPPVYSALAAIAVAFSYGINGIMMSEVLEKAKRPAGRLQLINGINDSLIIDDTYNSSPDSVFAGLKAIHDIPIEKRKRVWAILGSMKELGKLSQQGHEEVGQAACEYADLIVAVGAEAKTIYEAAKNNGCEKVWHFGNSDEAAATLEKMIEPGDLMFIKGSQAARMEKIVKRLMLDPSKANDLLVRQGSEWKDK